MAKQEIRRKANIGSSSLILIFIVLCLVTFSEMLLILEVLSWRV